MSEHDAAHSGLTDTMAMCTAWAHEDPKLWSEIAAEALGRDPLAMAGSLTFLAVELARRLARAVEWTGVECTVDDVLRQLALQVQQGVDEA